MLSHYRLLEKIGEGGMGVVWKAIDTTLDREVAIKVLPAAFAADADRLARFEREAKVLASLNHPNIASIFGLHEAEHLHFLVMELVTGESLGQRLARGPVPLFESLGLAVQITEALEAAHENGVVHRDLKPANIQVTPDGKIKVLDFGLAKALEPGPLSADPSASPTVTASGTVAGMILGTAAYMSPDQARGRPVDKQSDIWSFGCVLYELLTGQQAFGGETMSDVIAGVLEREPDWDRLPPATPWRVRNLVTHCLRKDARERLHDIADARIEINEALDRDDVMVDRPVSRTRSPTRVTVGVLAGVVIGAIVTGLALWTQTRTELREQKARRLSVTVAQDVEIPTEGRVLAISPDGNTLVYVGYQDGYRHLLRRQLDDFRAVPVPGTRGVFGPTISPDGRWVAFMAEGSLKKVPMNGGPVTTLGEASPWCDPVWWPDDTIVFFSPSQGLLRISSGGGAPESVTIIDFEPGEADVCPSRLLPGGRAMLSTVRSGDAPYVEVQSLISGERHVLTQGRAADLTSSKQLVFLMGDSLWAAPFDIAKLQMTGEQVLVLSGVKEYSLAHDGTLVYLPGSVQDLVLVDRDGRTTTVIEAGRHFFHPRISPDGSRVTVCTGFPGDIWVYDIRRGTKGRLTDDGRADDPVWSPTGRKIIYSMFGRGSYGRDIYLRSADGSGESQPLLSRGPHDFAKAWTSDGAMVVLATMTEGLADISLLSLEEDRSVTELLSGPADEREPALSPDDRWIAYVADDSGRDEVYVQSFPALGSKV
jgi:serine/threonine-protein kinase